MTPPGGAIQDFAAAAARHMDDANHLLAENRHVNADHFAGFAAECFLKSMLLAFLGGQISRRGRPYTPDPSTGKPREYGHLPWLWDDLTLLLSGRTGAATLGGVLSSENPFRDWRVEDRYTDGRHVQVADTNNRVRAADRLGVVHQQARLNGTLLW